MPPSNRQSKISPNAHHKSGYHKADRIVLKRLVFWLPLFFSLLVIGMLFLSLGLDPEHLPAARIGQKLPELSLPVLRVAGEQNRLKNLDFAKIVKGKAIIINFWASWCKPCRKEMDLLLQMKKRGYNIYGVNVKDNIDDARRFLGVFGNPFKLTGIDANAKAAIDMGVYGYPETFIVDGNGIVRYRHVGALEHRTITQKIYPLLEKLRAEQGDT